MTGKSSFFAELQRRHVYKVGAMYGVGGWLLVQVATQVFPFFDISNVAVRWVVIAIVAGFPVALVLAWLFDLTPQGIVRTEILPVASEAPAAARERRSMDRRLNIVLGTLLALGAAYVIAEHTLQTPADAPAAAADRSIAVLPFENLSRDPDNAYFATGIQDQVLTQLAKIGALKVISRTSTEQYAAKPASVGEIAKQLGVANILEGSVQKAGDSVRINVQLIRADGDTHLWAETYDRKLDNIFGVESEVAGAIADALNAKLSGAERQELAARPTDNTEAYEAYLRANLLYERGEVEADLREALRLSETAVRLDPGFAQAWALTSELHASFYIGGNDTSAAGRDAAHEALQNAIRLQPDQVEVRIAQGYYTYWVERDYEGARRIFEDTKPRAPSNANIPFALALITRRQGHWDESLVHFREAAALDPRNVEIISQAAFTAAAMRRYALADKYLDQVLDVSPGSNVGLMGKVQLYQMRGQLDQADAITSKIELDPTDLLGMVGLAQQKMLRRQYTEGAAMMRQIIARLPPSEVPGDGLYQYKLAQFLQLAGDEAGALACYRLAREHIGAQLRTQPDNDLLLVTMAVIETGLGNKDAALKQIQRAIELLPPDKDALDIAEHRSVVAQIHIRFGDREAAIDTLHDLLTLPSPERSTGGAPLTPALLRLDPAWDSLRAEPRFQQLLADSPMAEIKP